jgi:hypothetical protein
LGPIPNPQSPIPIPNPQSPMNCFLKNKSFKTDIKNIKSKNKNNGNFN